MKKVNWDFCWNREHREGSFEVEDDIPDYEINRMVIDEALSIGFISYNWTISGDTE